MISGGDYRYAFNGMESDNNSGINSYTTQFRQYDPRLGRWKSLDPLASKYPGQSPFVGFNNNPSYFVDPLGLDGEDPDGADAGGAGSDTPKKKFRWNKRNKSGESVEVGGVSAEADVDKVDITGPDAPPWYKVLIAKFKYKVIPKVKEALGKKKIEVEDKLEVYDDYITDTGAGQPGNPFASGSYTYRREMDRTDIWNEFINVNGPEYSVFIEPQSIVEDLKENLDISDALYYFYEKNEDKGYSDLEPLRNYGQSFGLDGLIFGDWNAATQFTGSYTIDVFPDAKEEKLIIVIMDNKSLTSLSYRLLGERHREDGSTRFTNIFMKFIFELPYNENYIRDYNQRKIDELKLSLEMNMEPFPASSFD